jgi:hypothetical protein
MVHPTSTLLRSIFKLAPEISMNTAHDSRFSRISLPQLLILLLAGAFPGLMVDIRVEHVDVVREHSIAWLPIIYSGFMTIACCFAFVWWNHTTRQIMRPLFLLAFVIGGMGFYLHNHGDLKEVIKTSVSAWTDSNMNHPDGPPQSAPLAFAGLGLIGLLASLRQFNTPTPSHQCQQPLPLGYSAARHPEAASWEGRSRR